MRRVRRRPQVRPARQWWLAAFAVIALLLAPMLVSPSHAHGASSAPPCGMDMPSHTMQASPTHGRGGVCSAACAVCAQLAPLRIEPAPSPRALATARIRYPSLELRLAGVEPDRGTPPPR